MGRLIKFEDFKAEDDMPKGTEDVIGGTPDNPSGCLPYAAQQEMAGPEEDTEEEVNGEQDEAELEEAKLTNKAQDYVTTKIAKLKGEGYPADQAAAIAFSMAKKRGFEVDESMIPEENEGETSDYDAPTDVVKPFDKEDEEKIKKVNEKTPHPRIKKMDEQKPNPHKHLKGRTEIDEDEDPEVEARPLDAQYITDGMTTYAGELKADAEDEEAYDVAAEMRQVARSMRAEFPNTGDIHLEQVLQIADEQGIEEDDILAKVKEEITYIWNQV